MGSGFLDERSDPRPDRTTNDPPWKYEKRIRDCLSRLDDGKDVSE